MAFEPIEEVSESIIAVVQIFQADRQGGDLFVQKSIVLSKPTDDLTVDMSSFTLSNISVAIVGDQNVGEGDLRMDLLEEFVY